MAEAAARTPSRFLGVDPRVDRYALRAAGSVRKGRAGAGSAGADPAVTLGPVDGVRTN